MGKTIFLDVSYLEILKIKLNEEMIQKSASKKKKILDRVFEYFFVSRVWLFLKNEKTAKIKFKILKTNCFTQNAYSFWKLKQMFKRQLPNIPKSYIAKLIFDKNHKSIIIQKFKKNKRCDIGGCSFRSFLDIEIVELVFFVIEKKEQTKGYGSFITLALKDYIESLGLGIIITCADNNAMAFFCKQGFTPRIRSNLEIWSGLIKDYTDVVLMEFLISKNSNFYCNFLSIFFQEIIKKRRCKDLNLKNFTFFDKKKIKKTFTVSLTLRNTFFFNEDIGEFLQIIDFQKNLIYFLNKIKQKHIWNFFEEPAGRFFLESLYYDSIDFDSIDIRTVEEKLRSTFHYKTYMFFFEDVDRSIRNRCYFSKKKNLK